MPRVITRITPLPATANEIQCFGEGSRAALVHTNHGRIRVLIHPREERDMGGLPSSTHLYVDSETGQCFECIGTLAQETWIHERL